MSNFPEEIELRKVKFQKIKDREYTDIAIYQNSTQILRIGNKDDLAKDFAMHQMLEKYNFTVPKIIETGHEKEYFFVIEERFSGTHLGQIMKSETSKNGEVSEETFHTLLSLVRKHADAELASQNIKETAVEFMHAEKILEELPDIRNEITEVLSIIKERLKDLPVVLTHGDFNPNNMFEEGFIDFEYMNYTRFGEDISNPLYHIYFFPRSSEYEYQRGYGWSLAQQKQLKDLLEKYHVFIYLNEFILMRSIFSAVRMHNTPKLQQWRYDLFKHLLQGYKDNKDLFLLLTSFPS